jgi:hypothetical protein
MRVNRYLLLVALPVPILALTAYQVSSLLHSRLLTVPPPVAGKEKVPLPDLQFKEAEFNREVLDLMALIEVKRPKPAPKPQPARKELQEKPPAYRVTFTYIGLKKSYAIINGQLFEEGDHVSPYERIVKITREGVLLSGRWGERWLPLLE